MKCGQCIRKNAIIEGEGFCPNEVAPDGWPFRCVGSWTNDKLIILDRYLDMFTRAMKGKWKHLVYIDLFSGPGKCYEYMNKKWLDSSPTIASRYSSFFDKYIFTDKDNRCIELLKKRLKGLSDTQVEYITGDCNKVIDSVLSGIPSGSLCVFFIDPTGLHFKFDSLKKILSDKKSKKDIIELFSYEMAIKRNFDRWAVKKSSRFLDEFLGVENSIGTITKKRSITGFYSEVVELYKKSISKCNPGYTENHSSVALRSSKNVPLHHLFYISSNKYGKKFFKKALKIDRQLSMFN